MRLVAIRKWCLAVPLALLGMWPSAAVASPVNMTLTGVGTNGVMGGVYIGPYVGTIDGQTFAIICDDFLADSYLNEAWTANVSTLSDLSQTKFGGQADALTKYEEVAWLAMQLAGASGAVAGQIQFALWSVFDPPALNSLSGSNLTGATNWLNAAQAAAPGFTTAQFSGFQIYTPTSTPPTCSGGPCPSSPPQEFVRFVTVPEPSTLSLLGLGLAGIAAAGRRRRQSA